MAKNTHHTQQQTHTQEEGIACKDSEVVFVLDVEANAALGVTGRPESLNGQRSDFELLSVLDNIVDLGNTGVGSKNSKTWLLGKQLDVAIGVIPVVVCDEDRGQFGVQVLNDMQQLLGFDRIDNGRLGRLFIKKYVGVVI